MGTSGEKHELHVTGSKWTKLYCELGHLANTVDLLCLMFVERKSPEYEDLKWLRRNLRRVARKMGPEFEEIVAASLTVWHRKCPLCNCLTYRHKDTLQCRGCAWTEEEAV